MPPSGGFAETKLKEKKSHSPQGHVTDSEKRTRRGLKKNSSLLSKKLPAGERRRPAESQPPRRVSNGHGDGGELRRNLSWLKTEGTPNQEKHIKMLERSEWPQPRIAHISGKSRRQEVKNKKKRTERKPKLGGRVGVLSKGRVHAVVNSLR